MLSLPITATANEDIIKQQRQWFIEAEQVLGKDIYAFNKLSAKLIDYPLYPYLRYTQLKYQGAKAKFSDIKAFSKKYADSPLASRLVSSYRYKLFVTANFSAYVQYANSKSKRAKDACRYAYALLMTGKKDQAMQRAKSLWLYGKSRPTACDALFSAWKKSGALTQDMIAKRGVLAMNKGQYKLVRYLHGLLSAKNNSVIKTKLNKWLQAHDQPQKILAHKVVAGLDKAILSHALQRLMRKDKDAAIKAWDKWHKYFSKDQQALLANKLALRLAWSHHPQALAFFKKHTPTNSEAIQWRVRTAIRMQQWGLVKKWIAALPATDHKRLQWQYWQARALESLGDQEQAQKIYRNIANNRDYYAFLAADRIKIPYIMRNEKLNKDAKALYALASTPAMLRVYELRALNRTLDALREWGYFIKNADKKTIINASLLAQHWAWHEQAIFTIARAKKWNDLVLRFPLAYKSEVIAKAKEQHLETAFVFAIIRQESAFARTAHSPAGARGLMQLMPATAKRTAKAAGIAYTGKSQLFNPEINISLGSLYLRKMLTAHKNNPALAAAAYNAGPLRVKRWTTDVHEMPADVWIESIPFDETRKYVRRVLEYMAIYESRLGKIPTRLAARLSDIGTIRTVQKTIN
ncbi:MAG: transglycosylase SLT domain-containing protein [Mariprofundales bacterium]